MFQRQTYTKKDSVIILTNSGISLPNGDFYQNEEIQLEDGSILKSYNWNGDKLVRMGFTRQYD